MCNTISMCITARSIKKMKEPGIIKVATRTNSAMLKKTTGHVYLIKLCQYVQALELSNNAFGCH